MSRKKEQPIEIPMPQVEPKKKEILSTKTLIILSILVLVIVIVMNIFTWYFGSYNTFVTARQDIDTQWSNIKTEYQRRSDLFYNMAEVAKGYASFEKDTMVQVTEARSMVSALGATKEQQMQTLNNIDSALTRLMVVFEKYPELKTIEQYNKLFEEMQRTENNIRTARADYNSLVRSYNILIMTFPRNLVAQQMGFSPEKYFENELGTTSAPKLNMSISG